MWLSPSSRPPPTTLEAHSGAMTWIGLLGVLGSVTLIGFMITWLKPVLLPFLLALFLSYLTTPLSEALARGVAWSQRRPSSREAAAAGVADDEEAAAPLLRGAEGGGGAIDSSEVQCRWFGVVLSLLVSIGAAVGFVGLCVLSLTAFDNRLPTYMDRAQVMWRRLLRYLASEAKLDFTMYEDAPDKVLQATMQQVVASTPQVIASVAMVLVFLVFLMAAHSPAATARRSALRRKIDEAVSKYLLLKSAIAAGTALTIFVFYLAIDFPRGLRLFVALCTFVLFFIPAFGPLLSTLVAVPIVILDNTFDTTRAVIAIAVPAALQIVVGNFVEPQVFGGRFQTSPVVILFGLSVWFMLWGPVGALLAVPLLSTLRIVCEALQKGDVGMPYTATMAALLGGKGIEAAFRSGQAAPGSPPGSSHDNAGGAARTPPRPAVESRFGASTQHGKVS